jgi:hypothetical protein
MRHRGMTNALLEAVINYGDRWVRRGRGVEAIWISDEKIRTLGPVTPEGVDVDRLKNLYVLVANDETVVTVVRSRKRIYRQEI